MKIINIYEYSVIYTNNDVTSKIDAVINIVSGIKTDTSNKSDAKAPLYGVVEEAVTLMSSHTMLMLITPMSIEDDIVEDTIILNRNHIRHVIGIDIVNPKKLMWSINLCNTRIEDMSSNNWYNTMNKLNNIDSNYVLVSCNDNKSWLKLTDVKNDIMLVPYIDNINLYNSSRVGLIDTLYQERSRLVDFRHMTVNDEVNKLYNNK
jgi:hypothetical protein